MELVPAGTPLSFEVTYDAADLDVGMSVYDDSGVAPVLVGSVLAMEHVALNTYRAKFTPVAGKNYIAIKAVYTDETLTTVDSNYSQGSESFYAAEILGQNNCSIVGLVDDDSPIVGVVDC